MHKESTTPTKHSRAWILTRRSSSSTHEPANGAGGLSACYHVQVGAGKKKCIFPIFFLQRPAASLCYHRLYAAVCTSRLRKHLLCQVATLGSGRLPALQTLMHSAVHGIGRWMADYLNQKCVGNVKGADICGKNPACTLGSVINLAVWS